MTYVKICGITNLEDAIVATEAGADYLGFILYPPSKRAVTKEVVKEIIATLRQRENCPILVGVFVNDSAETIANTLDFCGLDYAQLSGDEPPMIIGEPTSPIYGRAYKAIRPQIYEEAEADSEWFVPPAPDDKIPHLLIDAYHPTLYGGTGETSDWAMAEKLRSQVANLMLAGGLTAENVAQAVAEAKPWAVDVASGVEAEAGRKDHQKIRDFMTNTKNKELL